MVSQAHRRLPLQHKHFYFDVFSFSLASLVIKWFPRSLTCQTLINKKKEKEKNPFFEGSNNQYFYQNIKGGCLSVQLEVLTSWYSHASIWVSFRKNFVGERLILGKFVFHPVFSPLQSPIQARGGVRDAFFGGEGRALADSSSRGDPGLCQVWRRAEPLRAWLSAALVGTPCLAWKPQTQELMWAGLRETLASC